MRKVFVLYHRRESTAVMSDVPKLLEDQAAFLMHRSRDSTPAIPLLRCVNTRRAAIPVPVRRHRRCFCDDEPGGSALAIVHHVHLARDVAVPSAVRVRGAMTTRLRRTYGPRLRGEISFFMFSPSPVCNDCKFPKLVEIGLPFFLNA
jgi:hypothetical protein